MTTTQVGDLVVGDVGLQIKVTLTPAGDAFNLNNATSGDFVFERPDGSTWQHSLSVPADIIDPVNRIVRYILAAGDLTMKGVYTFKLFITGTSPNEILIANGAFTVEE